MGLDVFEGGQRRIFPLDQHEDVVPDLLCVGKGMASGMPISACLGRAELMNRWPPSGGEAIHTQTFLGHPLGCAAGIASLATLAEHNLVERAAELGDLVRRAAVAVDRKSTTRPPIPVSVSRPLAVMGRGLSSRAHSGWARNKSQSHSRVVAFFPKPQVYRTLGPASPRARM